MKESIVTCEEALAVIPYANLRLSTFKSQSCNLVLFEDQFINATFTQTLLKKEVARQKKQFEKEDGKKIKTGKIHMGVSLYFYSKYFDMLPEDIINEHEKNFCIPIQDISYLEYSFDQRELETDKAINKRKPGKLFVKTPYFEWNYSFASIPADELLKTLRKIFPTNNFLEDKLIFKKF
ncbi:MAG: hypothetical protein KAH01_02125 [Caldisericia bacterium]|nr:hypothetical protein [Caldisericia bacterium]